MSNSFDNTQVLLVDNGSLRPDATLCLREIAVRLGGLAGTRIRPVSLLHSNKVSPQALGGERAVVLEEALRALVAEGAHRFCIIPYFFGPSRALTHFIPQLFASLQKEIPELVISMAPPLYQVGEGRLAMILADGVRQIAERKGWRDPQVLLVDHGTPVVEVNRVRNEVARQLQELLQHWPVIATSMERREGLRYDFNEPLLETALELLPDQWAKVIVAMLFLGPGRHAGSDGDVATICQAALEKNPGLEVAMTPLVGEHPLLLEILKDRLLTSEHWSL